MANEDGSAADDIRARLRKLEAQNEEILQLLRRLGRNDRGNLQAAGPPQIKRRWSNASKHWEMFLEGTGWVRDWGNEAPPPP